MEDDQETQGLQDDEDEIVDQAVKEAFTETPVPTSTEKVQLRILKKNPPLILAEPQLVGILQRGRSHMIRLIEPF